MYVILAVTSPGEIEIWEGLLTFAFFPLTVFTAWIADIKIIQSLMYAQTCAPDLANPTKPQEFG
ncbi:hypothetical protein ANCDUO_14476 [Ancylostoma duodenale]|uniref:Uncharacterized protein n=1 Tax=Ancylostoma duodenale TaxID=51022 RepID=A0A0C2CGA9_9BILA|nr:hypothetical protein ANCDUO_14476 [Ancylostoma duodenale]